jgi:hypothetical protein
MRHVQRKLDDHCRVIQASDGGEKHLFDEQLVEIRPQSTFFGSGKANGTWEKDVQL